MKHALHCKLALIISFQLEDQGRTLTQKRFLLLLSLIPKLLLVESHCPLLNIFMKIQCLKYLDERIRNSTRLLGDDDI